jgi:hypothetical protein
MQTKIEDTFMISMKTLIIEGRYDSLVTKLSNKLLKVVKDSYAAVSNDRGEFAGRQIYFKNNTTVPDIIDDAYDGVYFEEVENETIPLDFYVSLKVQWVEELNDFRYGGDAYNDTAESANDLTPPLIEVRFELDPAEYPRILSDVAMQLRDILRHEIEHITQSGWNTKPGKYLPSDMKLRDKIQTGKMPPYRYFMLDKEIPAMIQGLYLKSKKSKIPFSQVVNDYLDIWVRGGHITSAQRSEILQTWRSHLPALSIRQEL